MSDQARKNFLAKTTSYNRDVSEAAGKSFGRIMFHNNPGWTIDQALEFIEMRNPRAPLYRSVYKDAFLSAFRQEKERQKLQAFHKQEFGNSEESSNMLLEKEDVTMSLIDQLTKKHSEVNWIKPAVLHQFGIIFGIIAMEKVPSTQQPGQWQWNLDIIVREDTLDPDVEFDIDLEKKTRSSVAAGSRDAMFTELQKHLPQWNCYYDAIPLEGQGTDKFFYKLCQLDEGDEGYKEPPKRQIVPRSNVVRPTIRVGSVNKFVPKTRQPIQNKSVNDIVENDPFLNDDQTS